MVGHQLDRLPVVAGVQRVHHRLTGQSVGLVPAGGPAVQVRDLLPGDLVEFAMQQPAQLPVEPVVPRSGSRRREQVPPPQIGDRELAIGLVGQCLDQLAAHPMRDRRSPHHVADPRRLLPEDLELEIFPDGRTGGRQQLVGVDRAVRPARRQRSQFEHGRPAVDVRAESASRVSRDRHAMRMQQVCRLLGREGQLFGTDLGQVAGEPPARQRQGRILAGSDDHTQIRAGVADEVLHDRQRGGVVLDCLEPVQHDDDRATTARERPDETRAALSQVRRGLTLGRPGQTGPGVQAGQQMRGRVTGVE